MIINQIIIFDFQSQTTYKYIFDEMYNMKFTTELMLNVNKII